MFDEILDSKLSEEDKKPLRLLQEAQNFSIAGTETTSWILSVRYMKESHFHLMKANLELDYDSTSPFYPDRSFEIENRIENCHS